MSLTALHFVGRPAPQFRLKVYLLPFCIGDLAGAAGCQQHQAQAGFRLGVSVITGQQSEELAQIGRQQTALFSLLGKATSERIRKTGLASAPTVPDSVIEYAGKIALALRVLVPQAPPVESPRISGSS